MIESVHLKNFQNHVDTFVDFNEGVNVIAGSSDNGKSAIIRAIRWVCTNTPSGSAFIRKGAKECTVTIQCTGSPAITRYKERKGKNLYFIGSRELAAVGSEVPQEVQEILGISDVNIQSQFGRYFMLQDSPGEVARQINKVTNCDIIDDAFLEVKRRINLIDGRMKDCLDKIKIHQKYLNKFKNLPVIEERADALEKAIIDYGQEHGIILRIEEIIRRYEATKDRDVEIEALISLEPSVKELTSLINQSLEAITLKDRLQSVVDAWSSARAGEIELDKWLCVEPLCTDLAECVNKLTDISADRVSLLQVVAQHDARTNKIDKLDTRITDLEVQLNDFRNQFDICPLCNQTMEGSCGTHEQ